MRTAAFIGVLLALTLIVMAVPASAQYRMTGSVTLEFMDSEVSLGPAEEAVVPLKVRAELECLPLHEPPSGGVLISGQRGTSFLGLDGMHYSTEAEPKHLSFRHAGSNVYVVDEVVALKIRTDLPVEEPKNSTVGYFTSGTGDNETCGPFGWSMPSAEPTSFILRLSPPEAAEVNESSGTSNLTAMAILFGTISVFARRRGSIRDDTSQA